MDMPVYSSRTPAPRGRSLLRPEWLIDAWMELMPPRQAETLRTLHQAVLAASPALMPCIKWGNVVYLRDGRPIAQLTPHRLAAHLQLLQPRRVRRTHHRGPGAGCLRFRHSQPIDAHEVTSQVVGVLRSLMR
jgi:Domain of unknown function (DU1801)